MKQIFSSYPDGITGFALVVLRGSAVALLVGILQSPYCPMPWLRVAAIAVAAALLLGFGTRPAVVLCAAIAASVVPAVDHLPMILVIGQGLGLLALLLLGPGAVSIDARLFGRRKISLDK